jgi:hypothetical protein
LITLIILGEEYRLRNSSLCSFLYPPVTSTLFGPNILLSTLFPTTFSICSFLNVGDQVLRPYRTTWKIIFFYVLILTSLDSRREDRRFWTDWYQSLPVFNLLWTCYLGDTWNIVTFQSGRKAARTFLLLALR